MKRHVTCICKEISTEVQMVKKDSCGAFSGSTIPPTLMQILKHPDMLSYTPVHVQYVSHYTPTCAHTHLHTLAIPSSLFILCRGSDGPLLFTSICHSCSITLPACFSTPSPSFFLTHTHTYTSTHTLYTLSLCVASSQVPFLIPAGKHKQNINTNKLLKQHFASVSLLTAEVALHTNTLTHG